MTNAFEYTKQEVQQFLETTQERTNNLKRSLEAKGYEVSSNGLRKGAFRFILNKELVKVKLVEECPHIKEFGFKPKRPAYTRLLIKVLHEDFKGEAVFMTYQDLAHHIYRQYRIKVDKDNLGAAYRELVAHGHARPLQVSENVYYSKMTRQPASEELMAKFHAYREEKKREGGYSFGRVWNTGLRKYELKPVKGKMLSGFHYKQEDAPREKKGIGFNFED